MAPQWQFTQDELERWRWTCVELHGQPIDSATSFENRMSCVLDAVRYAVQHHRSPPQPAIKRFEHSGALNAAIDA